MRAPSIFAAAMLGLATLPAAAQSPDQRAQPCPGAPATTTGSGISQSGDAPDDPARRQGLGQSGPQPHSTLRPDLTAPNLPRDGRNLAASTECAKETDPLESPWRQP